MNNKGINMITLIITIIIIIILASITVYHSVKTTEDATRKNTMEEMKNVEEVINVAKAKGMNGEFTPNEAFLIEDDELDSKYKGVLTSEQIENIKKVNKDANVDPLRKYYLLNQAGFDAEFRDSGNVSVSGLKKEYLVSYFDRVIIVNDNGTLLSSGKIDSTTPSDSEIKVVFTPNGSKTWAKTQSAQITVTGENIVSTEYAWTNSASEVTAALADKNTFSNTVSVDLKDKTGNDWYIWVWVKYTEDGNEKQYVQRSEAFYIDNTPPEGELDVTEIRK